MLKMNTRALPDIEDDDDKKNNLQIQEDRHQEVLKQTKTFVKTRSFITDEQLDEYRTNLNQEQFQQ